MSLKIVSLFFLGIFMISGVLGETTGATEWNVTTNETGNVVNYTQINYSLAELDVVANMSATLFWAEIELNTQEIDFGYVESGKTYTQKYRIKARGTTDIKVTPTLQNENDNIFSNLYLSRTTSGLKRIGTYHLLYNLSQNPRLWSVIGTNGLANITNSTGSNGEQTIRLDLTSFTGIVPFDEPRRNTIKFVITPVWYNMEPIFLNNTDNPLEDP